MGWALRLMGEVAAAQSPPLIEEALAAYREALGMAQEMGARPLEARCRLGLGTLYGQIDRSGEARTEFAISQGDFGALHMPFWLGEAEKKLAGLSR